MVGNQRLGRGSFFWGVGRKHPPNTYSAALARGLPSKGEMRRASIHERYDVGTGERLGKARKAERTGTSGTGETSGSASRTGICGIGGAGETSEKLWEAWEG